MMKRYRLTLILLTLCLILIPANLQAATEELRVAVMPFDYGDSNYSYYTHKDVLEGITQMVTDQLVQVKNIRVIERAQLENLMKEQGFSRSGLADPATMSKVGKVLGVDVLIFGIVNRLDVKETGGISLGPLKVSGVKAEVGMSVRIVRVDTGEILASVTGEDSNTDTSFKISDLRGLSFASESFAKSALGKSIQGATTQLVENIAEEMKKVSLKTANVEGTILKILGDKLIVNVGQAQNLREKQTGIIYQLIQVEGLSQPVSMPIGKVVVFSVDPNAAIVQIIEGGEEVKVGDLIRFEKL